MKKSTGWSQEADIADLLREADGVASVDGRFWDVASIGR
jgi:hypothetical protein